MYRKKVLFLIESLSGGGAEKVLVTLLKNLDKTRFDPLLCCVTDRGVYNEEVKSYARYSYILPDHSELHGLRLLCYKIKYKLIYSWLPPKWIYRLFIPKGNDVEVAFLEGFVSKILSGSTNGESRKIAWVHTDLVNNPWPVRTGIFSSEDRQRETYGRYDQLIAVSESVKRSLEKCLGYRFPIKVVYNPIDIAELHSKARTGEVLPPSQKGIRLLSVGRLVPQKAFDRLVRVVHRLKEEAIECELIILGEGSGRGDLCRLIEEYQRSDSVCLPGFVLNPYPYYLASDIFVCSSLAEGYSTAATEALLLGVPIVTTDCAGMQELFGGMQCGIITENDEDALYSGLKTMLTDEPFRTHCAKNALVRAGDFSLAVLMKNVEEILCN